MLRMIFTALVALGLVGCGTTPVSPTLLSDGQLLVQGLQALEAVAAFVPGIPAADVTLGADVLSAVQTGLTGLQGGTKTPADFIALAQAEVGKLTPIAQDMNANASITNGIAIIQKLVPVIAADVVPTMAASAAAPGVDPRSAMRAWISNPGAK